MNVLLKRWRLVVVPPFIAGIAASAYALTLTPLYTVRTRFTPEVGTESRLPTGVAGLAAQLGLSLGSSGGQSARFYSEVLTGREIMGRVLLSRYRDPREGKSQQDSATLLDVLEIDAVADSASRVEMGIRVLRTLATVGVDAQANIVELTVDAPGPHLAAAVGNRFIESLHEFNSLSRRSRARERRRFVEARVSDVESELRRREEALRVFYERNRTWNQSPQFTFEEGRLRRDLEIQQEVFLTLRREYEIARIEEVNETPVITVIDLAVAPLERSKPARRRLVLLVVVAAGMLSMLWAYLAEHVQRLRDEGEPGYVEFAHLVGEAKHHGIGRLGRMRKRITATRSS